MVTESELWTTSEVAREAEVCSETVREWVAAGSLPATRTRLGLLFRPGDVDVFIKRRRANRPAKPDAPR